MARTGLLGLAALACIAFGGLMAAPQAAAAQGQVNLAPIQPANPAFGQTAMFRILVSRGNRPVANAKVECWFSGRHGAQTNHWTVRSDRSGWANFTETIPRSWINKDTWVDLNAACPSIGAYGMWRVRGKR